MPDSTPDAIAAALAHWPSDAARRLAETIRRHAGTGAYAVFDMDNTLYRNDIEEALLPFLEAREIVTRETMDPSLAVVPFADEDGRRESLVGYYYRLCEIDDKVGYPWLAQIFAGLKVGDLAGHVAALLGSDEPLVATRFAGGRWIEEEIHRPAIFPAMVELVAALRAHDIAVYIVSAAHEELARVIGCDPVYGFGLPAENVIGVSTLLKDRAAGTVTTARKLMAEGLYHPDAVRDLELTATLWTPTTWMSGKVAAVREYIDLWRKAVVVAGDSPASDGYMLLQNVDIEQGGQRIWVDRSPVHRSALERQWIAPAAARQAALGEPVTADRNWIFVTPDALFVRAAA
ncbi:haloacid dehalogenase-like hydrolase [Segnochrobactrum spirostomi]|uniref:Haloacid dehalogenase-like hydrolase n=1 Tax=Segnochrobactrum spirostomi TaxID=2608987 RepID=A0A6A7XZ53_9HYPH|nr:haloacid dehalogenase-like hydrolase [Segnochrobactrum spirostomi]MQT11576.1 haloacid dehalogenase-like hydrolase [Segnochrobactrum spirostomi]